VVRSYHVMARPQVADGEKSGCRE